ncbi:MAG TPA: DUF3105 domain-containing protein [Acidobacteriota bacterium]|nr:DUF3105 domain-containing protein [Acidobacteriota bacterium]
MRRLDVLAIFFLFLASVSAACMSEDTVPLAYVASGGNNHVAVVDLQSGRTLRKIYAGTAPWKLIHDQRRERLYIQHWFSGSTAVLDLRDHRVIRVLPHRGPGLLDAGGKHFLTLSWPDSALHTLDGDSLQSLGQQVTEVSRAYALALDSSGDKLWMAQFDPMAEGPRQRYAYLVSYSLDQRRDSRDSPGSQPTGRSPVDIVPVEGHPFLLTADRGTNGLSLINRLGDGRAVPACRAPQKVVLSPDQTRMAVLCWDRGETRFSEIVSYRTDFTTRPWPTIAQEKTRRLQAGLSRGRFSPDGQRLYLLDEPGGRLLEIDPHGLQTLRELPVGDAPRDFVIISTPLSRRDRLATDAEAVRPMLRQALRAVLESGQSFRDLTWTETVRVMKEDAPSESDTDGNEAGEAEAPMEPEAGEALASEGDRSLSREGPAVDGGGEVVEEYTLQISLRAPDRLRSKSDEVLRLGAGGWSMAVGEQGRFWTTPRQELAWLIPSLPNFPLQEAVRQLAGDVSGSPFLRGGLAVDLVTRLEEDGRDFYLIGALRADQPGSQLWIDAQSGYPAKLVEQFPLYRPSGHGAESFSGLAETRYFDWKRHDSGVYLPRRLQRFSAGRLQEVEISGIAVNSGLPSRGVDLTALGGIKATPELIAPARPDPVPDRPGLAYPILDAPGYLHHPRAPHIPYNSNPPTSGPRLSGLAEWGPHPIPVPLELQVHNLEHGGILIQYNCPQGCAELVARLESFIEDRDRVLLAPYPLMDSRLALTAWGRLLRLESFDAPRMEAFIQAYSGKDHHVESP